MIRLFFVPLILCVAFGLLYLALFKTTTVYAEAAGGFVVAELFTSQGCSSCPAADLELASLKERADREGLAIYPISYHVQYWDYLGWKEPYGLAAGTIRQRAYAAKLASSVFTPQLILNGSISVVGSKSAAVKTAVDRLLASSSKSSLRILNVKGDEKSLAVTFKYESEQDKPFVQLVAVKATASNEVPRGENSGRTLSHVNVALALAGRVLESRAGQGVIELQVPEKADEVVLLLQQVTHGRVLAASASSL